MVSTGETLRSQRISGSIRPSTGNNFMVRSASSSFRNTKGKMDTLGERLNDVLNEIEQMRTYTKVTLHLSRSSS